MRRHRRLQNGGAGESSSSNRLPQIGHSTIIAVCQTLAGSTSFARFPQYIAPPATITTPRRGGATRHPAALLAAPLLSAVLPLPSAALPLPPPSADLPSAAAFCLYDSLR